MPMRSSFRPLFPFYRTTRLRMRPLREADRAEFIRVHEVSRAMLLPWSPAAFRDLAPDALFEQQLERSIRGAQDGTQCRLVGALDDGRIAGFFNLSEIVRGVFQNAYASWSVNAEVARQGFGLEGAQGLLDIAFLPPPVGLGLHRVQANAMPHNTPSIRIMEQAGFRLEGLARRYLQIDGEWQDHAMYARLAEEHPPVFAHLNPAASG